MHMVILMAWYSYAINYSVFCFRYTCMWCYLCFSVVAGGVMCFVVDVMYMTLLVCV